MREEFVTGSEVFFDKGVDSHTFSIPKSHRLVSSLDARILGDDYSKAMSDTEVIDRVAALDTAEQDIDARKPAMYRAAKGF
jgi:hypothetical protein